MVLSFDFYRRVFCIFARQALIKPYLRAPANLQDFIVYLRLLADRQVGAMMTKTFVRVFIIIIILFASSDFAAAKRTNEDEEL